MNSMNPSCVADTEDLSNLKMDIVLAGVGGQGTLVAGKLLGIAAMKLGLDVKVSEVHGMSQRGGSVITYVRIGKKVFSPIVENGTADVCLAFEELEALRWSALLKKGGTMTISILSLMSFTFSTGDPQKQPRAVFLQERIPCLSYTAVFREMACQPGLKTLRSASPPLKS